MQNHVGISKTESLKLVRDLMNQKETHLHGLLIAEHGKVVLEAYAKPYDKRFRHISHSLCKTVTGLGVGIAVQEGYIKLEQPVMDFFPEQVHLFTHPYFRQMQVEDLLKMSSGVSFREWSQAFSKDWIHSFFTAPIAFEPGTKFDYNSLNSYILGVIVTRSTGVPFIKYLNEKLFKPLNIKHIAWETCPKGYEKAGWGMYLHLKDMAKLGQLFLNEGTWQVNGEQKQIVARDYIKKATACRIEQDVDEAATGYGYHIWCIPDGYLLNGMFGQNVFVYPKRDLVIVMTAGSNHLFPAGEAFYRIQQFYYDTYTASKGKNRNPYVAKVCKLSLEGLTYGKKFTLVKPQNKDAAYQALLEKSIKEKEAVRKKYEKTLAGKTFILKRNGCSVFPYIIQLLYQKRSIGMKEISFGFSKEFFIEFAEEKNNNRIGVGFSKPVYSIVTLHEKHFLVGTTGAFAKDKKGRLTLTLLISFVEQANTRIIKFVFHKHKIKVLCKEEPKLSAIVPFEIPMHLKKIMKLPGYGVEKF